MHGAYLTINHAWRQWRPKWDPVRYERWMGPIGFVVTFGCVVVAMVVFRATTLAAAGRMYAGMAGVHGVSMPLAILDRSGPLGALLRSVGVVEDASSASHFVWTIIWLGTLFLVVTCLPNSLQIVRRFNPALHLPDDDKALGPAPAGWRSRLQAATTSMSPRWAFACAVFFVIGALGLNRPSEFLYWQF